MATASSHLKPPQDNSNPTDTLSPLGGGEDGITAAPAPFSTFQFSDPANIPLPSSAFSSSQHSVTNSPIPKQGYTSPSVSQSSDLLNTPLTSSHSSSSQPSEANSPTRTAASTSTATSQRISGRLTNIPPSTTAQPPEPPALPPRFLPKDGAPGDQSEHPVSSQRTFSSSESPVQGTEPPPPPPPQQQQQQFPSQPDGSPGSPVLPVLTALSPKTIVLCFDGTGNKFGTHNSNVVRFYNALEKKDPKTQVAYYQAGIGTYLKSQYMTKTFSWIASKVDEAFATSLPDHVKDGYAFLMNSYRSGDKVCLFGFSRGAYVARALAGMIYKVGILPPHNNQQVDFAFTIYKDDAGLGGKFRRAFATPMKIDFIGVWDTVSSVGIVPRTLPYSSQNDGVKIFRHALALDECRARFRPNVWGEPATLREELDDEPDIPERGSVPMDEWVYQPPNVTDVKEVWFAGCHADVGGGSHAVDIDVSLSNITLRWMIRECFIAKAGIRFDEKLLDELGLSIQKLQSNPQDVLISEIPGADPIFPSKPTVSANTTTALALILRLFYQLVWWILRFLPAIWNSLNPQATAQAETPAKGFAMDVFAETYNQLFEHRAWWVLEFIPMLSAYQNDDGSWKRKRWRNFGQGRYLSHAGNEVKVHRSVKSRMEHFKYTPAAYNWGKVCKDLKMVKWED